MLPFRETFHRLGVHATIFVATSISFRKANYVSIILLFSQILSRLRGKEQFFGNNVFLLLGH